MSDTRHIVLSGILFLFLLQLITDFFTSIYAFGLLVTSFTPETVSALLIFAPLALLILRRAPGRPALTVLVAVALLCRVIEPLLPLNGRLVVSGIGMASLLVFFPSWLAGRTSLPGTATGPGLVLAILLSVLFRTIGSGIDVSVAWLPAGLVLAAVAGLLLIKADCAPVTAEAQGPPASFPRLTGLVAGIASAVILLYFAFVSPTVMARWTGFSYLMVVTVEVAALVCFALLMRIDRVAALLTKNVMLAWNALFVLALVFTILPHQINFPADAAAYPLDEPAVSFLSIIPLAAMLVLSPVIVADILFFAGAVVRERPTVRRLGGVFGIASLFLLIMVFLHVFTTVYDYAPVVGPLFRDRFWLVHLIAGLGLCLPLLLVRREQFDIKPFGTGLPVNAVIALLAAGSVTAVIMTSSAPSLLEPAASLKIMSFNIQQGSDSNGNGNLIAVLKLIRDADPDLLGVIEGDTARIANGNSDAVRLFADRMNMYSYYGPRTTTGTFGIALLSKYPIEEPRTFFMYSSGEQTAAIHAKISVGGTKYNVFITHLGNDGPIVQLRNLLVRVKGSDRLIMAGDFNFQPTTEQYGLVTSSLADSWMARWPDGTHVPGADLKERIDYIYVSPGTNVLESEYVKGPASDHPFIYTVIGR